MGLYYFHIRDGESLIPDDEGMELADRAAVEWEAHLSANEIAGQYIRANKSTARLSIEVANESGAIVENKDGRHALH